MMARAERTHRFGVVYIARCSETDCVYIGKTIGRLVARRAAHFSAARMGKVSKFAAAIREYGERAFSFSEIACALTRYDIDALESILIAQYQAHKTGYNTGKPAKKVNRAKLAASAMQRDAEAKSKLTRLLFDAVSRTSMETVALALSGLR